MLVPGSVHFIIPSYKGTGTIEACLDSIVSQDYPKDLIRISVVENGPRTHINYLVPSYKNCSYYYNPVQGRSEARNFLLHEVESEFIAYVDVDVVLSKTWLKEALANITNSYCAASTGQIFRTGDRWIDDYRRKVSLNTNTMENPGSLGCINTAAVLMRTSILKDVGGFDTSFKRSEDLELTHRLLRSGYIISTSDNAIADVYWDRSYFEYFVNRFFQMGMYLAKAKLRHNINSKIGKTTLLFILGYYFGRLKFIRTKPYEPQVKPKIFFVSNEKLQMTAYEWNPEWEIIIIENIIRLYNRTYGKSLLPFTDVEKIIHGLLETSFYHIEGPEDQGPFNKLLKDQILEILKMPKVLVN